MLKIRETNCPSEILNLFEGKNILSLSQFLNELSLNGIKTIYLARIEGNSYFIFCEKLEQISEFEKNKKYYTLLVDDESNLSEKKYYFS